VRLLELIESQQLPTSLGGEGPEPYFKKPHTDYVLIGRKDIFIYTIDIPTNTRLVIDSYVNGSPLVLTVTSCGIDTNKDTVLLQQTLACDAVSSHNHPVRHLTTIEATQTDRKVKVQWANLDKWHGRHLVFSLNLEESAP
jgi:hypothetical protein